MPTPQLSDSMLIGALNLVEVTRWREKGGIKDLEKAKHFIDLLIELEGKK